MSGKKKLLLRVDTRLYEALEKWAADEIRSVNAQIEYLLTEAARRARRLSRPGEGKERRGGGGNDGPGGDRGCGSPVGGDAADSLD
jgi:hypothetical protein